VIGVIRQWSERAREFVGDAESRPRRVRLALEIALVVVLAIQAGRLGWIVFAPAEAAAPAAAARTANAPDYSIFQRFDAFFRTGAQSSYAEATAAGSSQMRLYGVRAGGPGGGSAIIGLSDGRQVSVGVGEEVEPGLKLQSVGTDHVTLSRGGSVTRLVFSETPMGVAAPPPPPSGEVTIMPTPPPAPPPPAQSGQVVDPAALMGQASLRPRMRGLGISGLTVSASGNPPALQAAGLQSGDVILAVNGTELNSPQSIAGLRGQLSNATSAEIRFERDGQVQTTTIRTR
jgi:general secretion pathway protein C